MIKQFLVLIFIVVSVGAYGAPANDPLSNFFKNKTKIEKPFEIRDPFKVPQVKQEDKDKKGSGFVVTDKGLYTNITEQTVQSVQDIKVIGVMIGRERRAMVAGPANSVIILKEGAKIGDEGAELKAILPGGIILVEKFVNVYGQEEYLETVIPISR
jgi:type IV pilus assembly protein PilP